MGKWKILLKQGLANEIDRYEINPGIKLTQEENQPEHEINQGDKEINHKKMHIF